MKHMHWCWCLECDANISVVSIIVDKEGLTTYVLDCGHRRKIKLENGVKK